MYGACEPPAAPPPDAGEAGDGETLDKLTRFQSQIQEKVKEWRLDAAARQSEKDDDVSQWIGSTIDALCDQIVQIGKDNE